jgi:VanZ family protein
MLVLFGASTSLGGPRHTSAFVRPFLLWLNPHMSEATIELIHHLIRKTAHFTEYGILGLLLWRLVHFEPIFAGWAVGREIVTALVLSALYASTDEFHQLFVPGRQSQVSDVILDTCGAGFVLLLIWLGRRSRRRTA